MADPRWLILPIPCFRNKWLHDDITAIRLKIIYVLANFLILSDTLLFKYFLLYVYFKENLDFANNLNNMTLLWRQITSKVNQVMPEVGNDD